MGDNEDRSGCYLSFRAPLETRPMAPSILVPLTSACDIITQRPDIDPNAEHCDKKSSAEGPFLTGGHPGSRHCSKEHFAASLGMFTNI